ncbi:PEP-CTERM sorting domain-containing protein [Undibacterium sp. Ren11W]|uniref:PEP-CTERM sorting domain-containing protein n=1 Tax=Undibacterium sp. Ren11W TaxID=3413045 RepID=UPI003BF3AF4F
MKLTFKTLASMIALVGVTGVVSTASATMITHEDAAGSFRTIRSAGSAPIGRLTVDSVQTLTGFGVDVDINGNSDLNFLIFNSNSGALLFQSGPKSFLDTGAGYKFSNAMSFTLQAGITYGLTAISNVGGSYFVDGAANNIGAFHFLTGNQNTTGTFTSISMTTGQACCDIGTALIVGPADAAAIPEPSSVLLFGAALTGLAAIRRRRSV